MKKILNALLILSFPFLATSQSIEIQGQLKITEMDAMNAENNLVVRSPDGTLATRTVASLPPPPDTTRTLQSDLLLTTLLCNCTSLPPALIQSLIQNGYSISDLLDFQISAPALLAGGVSVQALLDAGQTPIALFNGGLVLDSLYGKAYQGGILAFLDTNTGEGFVAASVNQSEEAPWEECFDQTYYGTLQGIGTGQANTTAIINACGSPGTAAKMCDDLVVGMYDDWFLPSISELNLLHDNLKLNGFGNFNDYGFSSYWSSSEENDDDLTPVWAIDFYDGSYQLGVRDSDWFAVRAVRAF